MELDHLFMFVEPNGPEVAALTQFGLVETYRREHPGQGTANVCYCFDNLYLELLWVVDRDAVCSEAIARTRLFERSRWQGRWACPFGIAWRGTAPEFGQPTWAFQPPYLPEGVSIAVACDSDDPGQPMMFKSPGSSAPADWPVDRRGCSGQPAWVPSVAFSLTCLHRRRPVRPCAGCLSIHISISVHRSPMILDWF